MNEDVIDFAADADAAPAESSLERAVALAQALIAAQDAVRAAEDALKSANDVVVQLEQVDLPELMRELGLSMFRLEDGRVVEVRPDVSCGITEANRAAAHAWLTERGFGGLIKTSVTVDFGRDEREAALACAQKIGGSMMERIHPATLKSFIKERMAAGESVPQELFGTHEFHRVKIT